MIKADMLVKIILTIYLLWASLHDIKKRALPAVGLAVGGVLSLLCIVLNKPEKEQWIVILLGTIPGIVLYLLAGISAGIGKADGMVLILTGCICGIKKTLFLFGLSLIYIFFFAAVVFIIKKNRKSRIPYIPFLLAAYVTALKI